MIKTENIKKSFGGVKAVDGLTISFPEGKIIGVIGPNGSGKSTLVNLLTGFTPYDSGLVKVGEHTVLKKIKAFDISSFGITRTFQDVRLFEQMLVMDNILIAITSRHVFGSLFEKHKKYHLDIAEQVLKKVDLWEKKDELAHNLSYGQRKLLEIGRVLAMDLGEENGLHTIFFDEPFAGLFQEMRKIVSKIIKELRDRGKTVIIIEHNMEIIRELCDYVFVLDSGKLLAEGKVDEVLSKKEVMEAYLGE